MSADLFITAETTLAQALNLPRKVIKTVRTDHLEQGKHWDYSKAVRTKGAVYFSRAGIEQTLAHLSIPPEKIALLVPPPADPAPAAPPAPAASDDQPIIITHREATPQEEAAIERLKETAWAPSKSNHPPAAIIGDNCMAALKKAGLMPGDSPPNDPPTAPPAAAPEPPLALGEAAVIEATVKRCYPLNRKLVGCTIGDAEVRVRVKSNEKLRPGMVLRVSLVEEDLYELAERLPRWPGKR